MFSARTKSSPRNLGNSPLGKIAQQRAIDSLQNIAGLEIGGDENASASGAPASLRLDSDLDAIVKLLKPESAVAIRAVAKELGWNADRAAEALMRGGQSGVLHFKKDQDTTMVTLA